MKQFHTLQKLARKYRITEIKNMSETNLRFFPQEIKKDILETLAEMIQYDHFKPKKKKLYAQLYVSLTYNSHNFDKTLSEYYDILKESIDNTFTLDIYSEEFRRRYNFLMLFVNTRDIKFFTSIIATYLKKYRKLKKPLQTKIDAIKCKNRKLYIYMIFYEMIKNDIDVSLEILLYLWTENQKGMAKVLKKTFTTFETKHFGTHPIKILKERLSNYEIAIYLDMVNDYTKEDLLFLEKMLAEKLQNSDCSLTTKMNDIIKFLKKTKNHIGIKNVILDFLENIQERYREYIVYYHSIERKNKMIFNIEIYRDYKTFDVKWERTKYYHKVISFPNELKQYEKYQQSCPYFIYTEGSGYNTTYYAKTGGEKTILPSPHFTSIESQILDLIQQDLLNLKLSDKYTITI